MKIEIKSKKEVVIIGKYQKVTVFERGDSLFAQNTRISPNFKSGFKSQKKRRKE